MSVRDIATSVEAGLPPIAGILLIVAAGGGFRQTLIDTGIGKLIADWIFFRSEFTECWAYRSPRRRRWRRPCIPARGA
jgi:hypothetical protein